MPGRILLADDDPSVRKMTQVRLEHAGYEVVTAKDGEEVLQQVASDGAIDLILLDLSMPRLNGLEVCQRLKAQPSTAAIPIIILSASDTFLERLADLCLELGAIDWIAKPFRSPDLLAKIQHVMDAHAPVHPMQATRRMRVLVVDDDRGVHELLTQALPVHDVEVVAVSSGREAVAAVTTNSFSVALVDIIMPGMDGLETLKALLAIQPQLPVIMMTGYQVEDLVSLALHFGAVDFLRKPFESERVLNALERVRKQ